MFVTDIPKLSILPIGGPFVVESLISTVESTEPSDVAANASKSDGGWKRSEDAANNKMKKRSRCIPIFIDHLSSKLS
jgi:hypothetical protein